MSFQYNSTTDYSQFKRFECNRCENASHIEKLIQSISIKNKLHLYPIIVDKNMHVIDGSHRLAAARTLKVPIFFVIDDKGNKSDMISYNSVRTNWKMPEYIYFYHQEGNEEYSYMMKMIHLSKSLNIPFTTLYNAICFFCFGDIRAFPGKVKDGTVVLKNKETFKDFIDITFPLCKEVNTLITTYNKKVSSQLFFKVPYILVFCLLYDNLPRDVYLDVWEYIKANYKAFTDTNSKLDIFTTISNLYNAKKSTNRIDFSNIEDILKEKIKTLKKCKKKF